MRQVLNAVGRAVGLWVGMIFGTIVSGMVVHAVSHPGVPDGPLSVLPAMLLVNALGALVVTGLAARLAVGGVRKAAILFLVVFALETGLSWIEALAFNQSLGLTPADLSAMVSGGLVRALATAVFATLLWPRAGDSVAAIAPGLVRLFAVVVLYIALYFAAGMVIAWRSAAVRDYYQGGMHIDTMALLALQVGRGMLWAGLAWLLAARLRGRVIVVAGWTAAAFAVLMVAPLLYPNAIMPWRVREVHLVELAVSNAAFGLLAVLLLRWPRRSEPSRRASRVK